MDMNESLVPLLEMLKCLQWIYLLSKNSETERVIQKFDLKVRLAQHFGMKIEINFMQCAKSKFSAQHQTMQ